MYRPGELDELIDIHRPVRTPDDQLGATETWQEVSLQEWCKVKPAGGGERLEHDKVTATPSTRFIIRYRDDIQEKDRITWDGDYYNVTKINKRGARAMYLELEAETGVGV